MTATAFRPPRSPHPLTIALHEGQPPSVRAKARAELRRVIAEHDGRLERIGEAIGLSRSRTIDLIARAELGDVAAAARAAAGVPGPRSSQLGQEQDHGKAARGSRGG